MVLVPTWASAAREKRSRSLSVQVRMLPATASVRSVHGRALTGKMPGYQREAVHPCGSIK